MSDATLSKEAINFLNLLKIRVQEADKVGSLLDDVEEKREQYKLQDYETAKKTLEQASQSLEKAERLIGMPRRVDEALKMLEAHIQELESTDAVGGSARNNNKPDDILALVKSVGFAPPPKGMPGEKLRARVEHDLSELFIPWAGYSKAIIDQKADQAALSLGGLVAKCPVKDLGRAAPKVLADYGGDASRIKDLARNTVVLDTAHLPGDPDNDKEKEIEELLRSNFGDPENPEGLKYKIVKSSVDPMGYSGINITVTAAGMSAEVQMNSPPMIWAKDTHAKEILGEEMFKAISDAVGEDAGQGHGFYEKWQLLHREVQRLAREGDAENQAKGLSVEMERLQTISRSYYERVRKRTEHMDFTKLMAEERKNRENK